MESRASLSVVMLSVLPGCRVAVGQQRWPEDSREMWGEAEPWRWLSSPRASLGRVGPALPWGWGSEQSPSPPLLPDRFQRDVASSNWTFLHHLRAPGDYRMSFPLQGFLINISIIELN